MPSIPRAGKVTTAFDFDANLRAALLAFANARGSTLTHELHEAVRRHLAYPPALTALPDAQPPRPRKRATKKS